MSNPVPLTVGAAVTAARRALEAAGIVTARIEAEALVEDATGIRRAVIFAHPERPLEADQRERLNAWTARRASGEPLQYVTGRAGFFGRLFSVTPDVLIPRPETEVVVEHALALWDAPSRAGRPAADVGTGSGIIAITLALERPGREVHATDVSDAVLAVARANARALGAERVVFESGDLLEPMGRRAGVRRFGLVVANPPYVAMSEIAQLPREVRDHEPRGALDGGPDGLAVIRRLVATAPDVLADSGALVLEIGETQGEAVLEIVRRTSYYRAAHLHADLAGRQRIVTAEIERQAR